MPVFRAIEVTAVERKPRAVDGAARQPATLLRPATKPLVRARRPAVDTEPAERATSLVQVLNAIADDMIAVKTPKAASQSAHEECDDDAECQEFITCYPQSALEYGTVQYYTVVRTVDSS